MYYLIPIISVIAYTGYEHLKEKHRLRVDKARNDFTNVKNLMRDSQEVCKTWTNSPCHTADDIGKFVRLYAIQKALDNKKISPENVKADDIKPNEEFKRVKLNRDAIETYYASNLDLLKETRHPGPGEFAMFLTFHSAIYHGGIFGGEQNPASNFFDEFSNSTHEGVMNALEDSDREDIRKEVLEFRKKIRHSFVDIHNEIFPKGSNS